jgi:stress-induced morphogen
MVIQVMGEPDAEATIEEIRASILEVIPDADVAISSGGPGHFEIRVSSPEFAGKTRVAQQQLVYGSITHLMAGSSPPVHAVDSLECVVP